jgi:hypothetical protein
VRKAVVVFYSDFEPACYEGALDAGRVGSVDRNFLVRRGIIGWASGDWGGLVSHHVLEEPRTLEEVLVPRRWVDDAVLSHL